MTKVRIRDCGTMEDAVLLGDTRCVREHDVSEACDSIATATDLDETGMLVNLVVVVRTSRPGDTDYLRTVYRGSHFTNTLIQCVDGTVFVETNATDANGKRIWRWCDVLGVAPE